MRGKIVTILLLIFSLFIELSPLLAASAKLHIDVGLNHFYKKRYLEAFQEFKAAAEVDPKNAEAHYNLGRIYKMQGFLKEAVVEFQIALALDPDYLAVKRELSQIKGAIQADVATRLKIQGQEEAYKQRATEYGTSTAEQRGQELLRKGDIANAIPAFEDALRSDPSNPRLFKILGFLYFKLEKYSNSLEKYEQALKYAPADAEISYAMGLIYLRSQDYDRTVEMLKRAIELAPDLVKAHFALGEAYESLGRFEDAAFEYKKCASLNPNLKEAQDRLRDLGGRLSYNYFSRGSYFYQQGDYEKAEALLNLAKDYGSLTEAQQRQVDEMIGAAQYWIGKQKAEAKVSVERREVRANSYINKVIKVEDVTVNPNPYLGQPVEWEGMAVFTDEKKGKQRFFANANQNIKEDSSMSSTFGIVFPKPLPQDPRVSVYSTKIQVKGKIIGVEKLFNTITTIQSAARQPIIEATEITFIRENYEQPLIIRYY